MNSWINLIWRNNFFDKLDCVFICVIGQSLPCANYLFVFGTFEIVTFMPLNLVSIAKVVVTCLSIVCSMCIIQIDYLRVLFSYDWWIQLEFNHPARSQDFMFPRRLILSHFKSWIEKDVAANKTKTQYDYEEKIVKSHDSAEESFVLPSSDSNKIKFFENKQSFLSTRWQKYFDANQKS